MSPTRQKIANQKQILCIFDIPEITLEYFFVLQDAYAEPGQDSRNIAGIDVVIIVEDVQDVAPVFTLAPPVTRLPSGLIPGDKVTRPHLIHLRPLSTTFSFLADSPSSR